MGHPRDEIYDFSIANLCSTSCATETNYFVDIKTWNDLKNTLHGEANRIK